MNANYGIIVVTRVADALCLVARRVVCRADRDQRALPTSAEPEPARRGVVLDATLCAWLRRVPGGAAESTVAMGGGLPFVSMHVPCYNEPPDMVIATLTSLTRLDYPNYEIIVLDDNSSDESLWRPVEAWCGDHRVKSVHLQDWPGYKAGALNYALREMIDPRAEVIGVIDSDTNCVRNSCVVVRRCSRISRLALFRRRRIIGTGPKRPFIAVCITHTNISSRSRNLHAMSATARSSPARWA